jgi:hypothetical protein
LPDISVFWIGAPLAVVIEIFVAGHVDGNVLAAASAVFARIARLRPAIKVVWRLDIGHVIAELIGAGEGAFLSFLQTIRISGAGDFSFSAINGGDGLIPVLVGIQPKCASTSYIEGQIGSVDFDGIIAIEAVHADIERAKRKPELGDIIAEIKKSHAGLGTQADGCGPDLNLCTGVPVDPNIVAHG